jgi:hypothetical protein
MLKRVDLILAGLLVALGVLHTVLTPVFHALYSLQSLWFAGTGLALLFLGLLQWLRISNLTIASASISFGAALTLAIVFLLVSFKLHGWLGFSVTGLIAASVFTSFISILQAKSLRQPAADPVSA